MRSAKRFDDLHNLRDAVNAITSDGITGWPELFWLMGQLTGMAAKLVGTLPDKQGDFEELVEAAEQRYWQYVAPLELSNLPPPMTHKEVHEMVRGYIRPTMAAFYETLPD